MQPMCAWMYSLCWTLVSSHKALNWDVFCLISHFTWTCFFILICVHGCTIAIWILTQHSTFLVSFPPIMSWIYHVRVSSIMCGSHRYLLPLSILKNHEKENKKLRFQGIIACFGDGGNLMEQRFGVCFVMEGLKINRWISKRRVRYIIILWDFTRGHIPMFWKMILLPWYFYKNIK